MAFISNKAVAGLLSMLAIINFHVSESVRHVGKKKETGKFIFALNFEKLTINASILLLVSWHGVQLLSLRPK